MDGVTETTLAGMIDARCPDRGCTSKGMYRMVGRCSNCGTSDFLILYTEGHEKRDVDCPRCGCSYSMVPSRLATDDEIPVAADA